MGQQVTIFGKTYANMEQAIDAMKISVKVPDDAFTKLYDIELLLSVADLRGTSLKFIGLDNKARYAVIWSDKLQTTRQMLEFYRPDLLNLYDKANPHGKYHPYSSPEQSVMLTCTEFSPLPYVKNIEKMKLMDDESRDNLLNILHMCYDELAGKQINVYELKENVYLLLDVQSCVEFLDNADWNIVRNDNEDIITIWPEVTAKNIGKLENVFVFDQNTGRMYSSKDWHIKGDNSKLKIGSWATMQYLKQKS